MVSYQFSQRSPLTGWSATSLLKTSLACSVVVLSDVDICMHPAEREAVRVPDGCSARPYLMFKFNFLQAPYLCKQ
jgi:hypothetical protein